MTSESTFSKQAIRKEARLKQQTLSAETIIEKSNSIIDSVWKLPEMQLFKTICVYASTDKEVHTDEFINELIKQGKDVYLPKITDNTLTLHLVSSLETLSVGAFSIMEPSGDSATIHHEHIDVFIIPGLGFDTRGTRLGRGKGFYDRLLTNVPAPKIGLAFSHQIFPLLPRNDYDILMDVIVTEEYIIRPVNS